MTPLGREVARLEVARLERALRMAREKRLALSLAPATREP